MKELQTDVLIVGGGTGGVAAALAVARSGVRCIITDPTDWLGGQLTSQGVPPDENRWIEGKDNTQAATRSYLDFRTAVRSWYRQNRPLTEAARAEPALNPGNGWVSRLCFEPTVGHAVLMDMLKLHVDAGLITILYHTEPVAADTGGDRVNAVTVRNMQTGDETTISATYFLDATELGDLLPLAKVEYHIGAEHTSVFGELHGRPDKSDPQDQQAITWCFALSHHAGENHTIAKPASYSFWRDYVPPVTPPWPGKLLSWTVCGGEEHTAREFRWIPAPAEPPEGELEMWRYRRITDEKLYLPGAGFTDVALINMVQNDYFLHPILDVTREERDKRLAAAKELSLCLVYWMQTEAPRWDGSGTGYPGLKLRGDELGTTDGFAKHAYIREARRLAARTMIVESHVGQEQRKKEGRIPKGAPPWGLAEPYADSVGIGHYRLDLHPSTAMRNSIYVHAAPFRIPLGSIIPRRVRNVLAAAKNLGVTHVTNGCYRLHPVEWNIGEAAGLLAAHCMKSGLEPHQVHADLSRVREFQRLCVVHGFALSWPWENGAGL